RDGQKHSTVTPEEKTSKNEKTKTVEADMSELTDRSTNMVGNIAEVEADSGEESPTDEAVSSQIYHELRSGQRYVDSTPTQIHTGQLDQQGDGDESVVHELRDG